MEYNNYDAKTKNSFEYYTPGYGVRYLVFEWINWIFYGNLIKVTSSKQLTAINAVGPPHAACRTHDITKWLGFGVRFRWLLLRTWFIFIAFFRVIFSAWCRFGFFFFFSLRFIWHGLRDISGCLLLLFVDRRVLHSFWISFWWNTFCRGFRLDFRRWRCLLSGSWRFFRFDLCRWRWCLRRTYGGRFLGFALFRGFPFSFCARRLAIGRFILFRLSRLFGFLILNYYFSFGDRGRCE